MCASVLAMWCSRRYISSLKGECRVPSFSDHRTSFEHRRTLELLRALLVLRACGSDMLVDNGLRIFRTVHRVAGDRPLGWLLGPTVYAQFVAGGAPADVARVADALRKLGLRLMVAPTLEEDVGEGSDSQDKYDRNLSELLRLAETAHDSGGQRPCLQVKVTGLLPADTLQNLSKLFCGRESARTSLVEQMAAVVSGGRRTLELDGLGRDDTDNVTLAAGRLRRLGDAAAARDVTLLVDAEYSYVNPGCSLITLAAMATFNKERPLVGNTYQCYFKATDDNLRSELDITDALGVCFAAKIVRGAYLERERALGVGSTCESHALTGQNYDRVIGRALLHATKCPRHCFLVVATHNEDSVRNALLEMHRLGIDPVTGCVKFAQIYGMAEQISMPLARSGYQVYKSVPVGPLGQVLPYLARRVAENRAVLHGARKERTLLQQELWFRLRSALHVERH